MFSFTVQLSQPYPTTRNTIALTIWAFVHRIMSLLFNTLPWFVIALLPRCNHLLTSWLQSPPAVILEPKKRKSVTTSIFSPSICHEVMGPDAMILVVCLFVCLFQYLLLSWLFHSPPSLSSIEAGETATLDMRMIPLYLRYVDDTTLKAESEVELKSLLMRVKEESERTILRLNI